MARSRLYLMPEDHDHFLRIFPEARALPWTHFPEAGYWQVEFDPDDPTPAEAAALGESRAICLERLRRLGYTEPPAREEDGGPEASRAGYAGEGAGPPLVRPFLLLLLILAAVGSGTVFLISRESPPPPVVAPSPETAQPEAGSPSDPAADRAAEPSPRPLDADIIALLDQCRRYLQDGNLTTGEAGNALECYRQVLAYVPDNMEARGGIRRIEKHFIARAEAALNRLDAAAAAQFLAILDRVNPDSVHLARLWDNLERLRGRRVAPAAAPESPPEKNGPLPPKSDQSGETSEAAEVSDSRPASSAPGTGAEPSRDSAPPDAGSAAGRNGGRRYDTETLIRESPGAGFQPKGEGAD
jgi:hypothetical protein